MGITLNPFTGQLDITGASVAGNTIVPYANFAAFPSVTTANNGQFGVALDTGNVYEVIAGVWTIVAGPADILSVGTIDSQTPSANGAVDHANQLIMQSASATVPGLVNNTTQTLGSGTKTVDNLIDSGLTASTALTANASKQLVSSSTTDTELGYVHGVTSAIQTQLNAKQSTTLTNTHILVGNGSNVATDVAASGDLTLANTGAFTLATVNASPGTTAISTVTTNAKGLVTSNTAATTTGSGSVVLATSPTLVTPALGTPSALVGTNITGTATSFTASNVTTNANMTGDVTSVGNTTTVAKIQGTTVSGTTGSTNVVFSSAPTLSNPVVGTQSTSDNSTKAASTAYVTTAIANAVAGVNPALAVQAATTAASDTSGYTYNNGVAGIGATLTANASNTALTVDGYTFTALNQRLLVKNDTQSPSGAYNGIYYVTQVQALGLPVILTRALDFDTPSDINNTGAIPVVNGTVNGTTSWVVTSSVTTVGTDPITFTKFTRNPADYLLVANNLSDVASKSTSFNNLSPMTTSGDIIYGGASGTGTRLAANSTATKEYLQSVSSGIPSWAQVAYADLSGSGSTNITTVGTITTGTWTGTTIAILNGGTGQTSKTAGFDALQPMTTGGDLIYGGASGTGTRLANGTAGQALLSAGTTLAPVWTSPQTSPTASTNAAWDANKNLSSNNFLAGYRTQATANGTLTLVVGDAQQQYFTGSTSGQILKLPVTSTLVNGFSYIVTNNSTQTVTVNSSGSNLVLSQAASSTVIYTVINTAATDATGWSVASATSASNITGVVAKANGGTGSSTYPGDYYYSGYYTSSNSSNYWSNTNTSFGDYTTNGTIPSITLIVNSNFGTVSKATSNLPGINFSAPRTGTIKMTVTLAHGPAQNAGTTEGAVKLHESTTSTDMAFARAFMTTNNTIGLEYPITLVGYFAATTSTTYNFKLQSSTASGTNYIGGGSVTSSMLSFAMEYIS